MPTTVTEMIRFLEQFPGDTVVQVILPNSYGNDQGDLELPESVDLTALVETYTFGYTPPHEAWSYRPTEEAASRGQVARDWPYRPATIRLGVE